MITQKPVYYADQWMCEIPGVAGTLGEVAQQLANGVRCWSDDDTWLVEPQPVPSRHAASSVTYFYVACQRVDDRYAIPDDLPGTVHAVAYGDGDGWSQDMLISSWAHENLCDADLTQNSDLSWYLDLDVHGRKFAQMALREYGSDSVEYLVCRTPEMRGELILTAGPEARFETRIGGAT